MWWLTSEPGNVNIEPATGTQTLPVQTAAAAVAAAAAAASASADKTMTLPAVVTEAPDDANLQRTQSARFPPEKRPESKSWLNRWWLLISRKY